MQKLPYNIRDIKFLQKKNALSYKNYIHMKVFDARKVYIRKQQNSFVSI